MAQQRCSIGSVVNGRLVLKLIVLNDAVYLKSETNVEIVIHADATDRWQCLIVMRFVVRLVNSSANQNSSWCLPKRILST